MIRKFFAGCISLLIATRNIRFFFLKRPATPLRIGLIAAFDYIAALHGFDLSRSVRADAAFFTDIASLMNKFYDGKTFNINEYRTLRRECRDCSRLLKILPGYRKEIKSSSRSKGFKNTEEVLSARENETRIIFLTLCSILQLPVKTLDENCEYSSVEKDVFALLQVGYIIQMYDDILDSDFDNQHSIPSYVTAYTLSKGLSRAQSLYMLLKRSKRHLLLIAQSRSRAQIPLYIAGQCTYWLSRITSFRYVLLSQAH